MNLEQVTCGVSPGHQRAGKRNKDLSVILPQGAVEDFVWTWYSECMVQNQVLEIFNREHFTGFEVMPVKARFTQGLVNPPTLSELVVTAWGGVARPESGIRRIDFCEECKYVRYSGLRNAQQLMDESQWDGSDFFMIWPMPRFVFVTQRVADSVRDHQLSGVVLEAIHELKENPAVIEGFSPGRLSYWMPEKRAMELGTLAGIAEI